MFTSKSFFLLVSIILFFAIGLNTDITMVYILFALASVMFLLSFGHLWLNTPHITISREVLEIRDIAYEDDIVNVKLEIYNKHPFNIYFCELVDMFSGAEPGAEKTSLFVLNMKGKEKKTINYVINCYKRGLHKLGPLSVVSMDAFGFFKIKKTFNIFSEILVYPRTFKIFSFPSLLTGPVSWLGVETAKISGDTHEFFGIREYQRGDTMSRIHWPSTARHNKFIVKQYERSAVHEATIILDLVKSNNIGIGKKTTLEYSVKIAASIAKYLLEEGALVQLIGYGKEHLMLPFGKGESHIFKILENLANVQADGDTPLSQALEETSFFTAPQSTLIVIMLDNDKDSLPNLLHFKVKDIKLILFALTSVTFGKIEGPGHLDVKAAKRFDEALASLGACVYRISKGDDLESKFEAEVKSP